MPDVDLGGVLSAVTDYGDARVAHETARGDAALAVVQADLDAARARVAELEAQLPPDPDPVRPVLFGTSGRSLAHIEEVRGWMAAGGQTMGVIRHFFTPGSTATDWDQVEKLRYATEKNLAVVLSYRDNWTTGDAATFLKTVPDSVRAAGLWVARWHEPENDGLTEAQKVEYRRQQVEHAKAARDSGFPSCSILMGYTLQRGSGRNPLDWIAVDSSGVPVVDVLGWDKYNSGNKANPPVYQDPARMIDEVTAFSRAHGGKPWLLGETGSNRFGELGPRVEWTRDLADTIKSVAADPTQPRPLVACWWSAAGANGFDARLEPQTAAVWG